MRKTPASTWAPLVVSRARPTLVLGSGRARRKSPPVAPYTDINAYQDGIKLDRSYKVQDQRAQKQIEPGGKLKSFTAFAPDSETVPVTVKVMAPGEKEPRSERCYCIVNPGLQ